jgi:tellurite resistance protein TerC
MSGEVALWIAFGVLVPVVLFLDLGVFHRRAHAVKLKEALVWSAVWIALAILFGLAIYLVLGHGQAILFFTGYLVEESLSVDNLFVFLLIFTYFSVSPAHQHRVLFWGILGAVIMRAIFIICGLTLLENFHWVIYIFGAFLIYTAVMMSLKKEREIHPEANPVLRLFRRLVPMTKKCHGDRFFVRGGGRRLATPLLMVLVVIETTDVVFAVDSIPAVLAITTDRFLVYTSNIFAILGLRALYFALAGVIQRLYYLNYGLAAVLLFLGLKMLFSVVYEMPAALSLGVVLVILAISVLASVVRARRKA